MKTKQFIVRWRRWRRRWRRRRKESNSSVEEDDEKKPIHLKEDKEDGYLVIDVDEYKDFLDELKLRDVAYISLEPIDDNNYNILVKSYLEAVDDIECKKKDKKPFLRKIDAHSCADCRFKEYCRR